MKKIYKILLISVFLSTYLFFFPSARAQNSTPAEGLTLSPPILELNLDPSQKYDETVRLTNPTQSLVELYPQVMDFHASGEGGEPTFTKPTTEGAKFSLANWIRFGPSKIALAPGQIAEYIFKISVPADAEPGGHYGVMFFGTEPPKAEGQNSQVTLASMVGALILGKVPGEINEKASLVEFSSQKFYIKPSTSFTVRVQNSGNVHFKPQGEIQIKNWFGNIVGRVAVNDAKGNVLPDSIRKFTETWKPPKWYSLGRYKTTLTLNYGVTNQSLTGNLTFWYIPWWLIVMIVVIVLVAVYFIIRYFKKRPKKRYQEKKVILR